MIDLHSTRSSDFQQNYSLIFSWHNWSTEHNILSCNSKLYFYKYKIAEVSTLLQRTFRTKLWPAFVLSAWASESPLTWKIPSWFYQLGSPFHAKALNYPLILFQSDKIHSTIPSLRLTSSTLGPFSMPKRRIFRSFRVVHTEASKYPPFFSMGSNLLLRKKVSCLSCDDDL